MKYIVRLNQKSVNPITLRVDPRILWEVEQVGDRDSEKVVWHCAEVEINGRPLREFFTLPKKGEPPTELTYHGVVTRGQNNAIVILTRATEVM